MRMGSVRLLPWVLGACSLAACGSPEPAAAPRASAAPSDGRIEREQQAIEHRLRKLQHQALSELRKLRESRQASAGPAAAARDEAAESTTECELLVFGGTSHETFLGCLCDEHHADSVFNMLGEHGSHLSPTSMRNKFGAYGSNHDDTSACNARATRPPVVVASDGKSLGMLTLNASLKRRISAPSVTDWLARMCGE
jgi:hypothetical protein